MDIEIIKHDNDILEIKPIGDLDTYTSEDFAEKMKQTLEAGALKAILNLEKVPYVSSLGIGEIIQIWDRLRTGGGILKFANMTDGVFKVFKLVGLTTRFEIFSDCDTALNSF